MKLSFIIAIIVLLIDAGLVHYGLINPFVGFGVALLCTIPLAMD